MTRFSPVGIAIGAAAFAAAFLLTLSLVHAKERRHHGGKHYRGSTAPQFYVFLPSPPRDPWDCRAGRYLSRMWAARGRYLEAEAAWCGRPRPAPRPDPATANAPAIPEIAAGLASDSTERQHRAEMCLALGPAREQRECMGLVP